jgi:hypothetical protein
VVGHGQSGVMRGSLKYELVKVELLGDLNVCLGNNELQFEQDFDFINRSDRDAYLPT